MTAFQKAVRKDIPLLCTRCGQPFHRKPSEAAMAKFCSRTCKDAARWTRPVNSARPCVVCGASFTPHRSRGDARFCSKSCTGRAADHGRLADMARSSASARGDAQRDRGEGKSYRKVGGRHEHRIVAERTIGRPLVPGEVVHHVDGNHRNNAPENLQVMSQAEHIRLHKEEGTLR